MQMKHCDEGIQWFPPEPKQEFVTPTCFFPKQCFTLGRRFRLRRNAVLRFYVDFDCAGSHKGWVPEIAISKTSFYRVFVYLFGHELHLI